MSKNHEYEKFENLDHFRGNEAFSEYKTHWDNFDPRIKDLNLKKFVCKMPLAPQQRRNLLNAIDSPLV